MTVEPGEEERGAELGRDTGQLPRDAAGRPLRDAGHLDEDAEAFEDPVHAGDAIHQHELHEQRQPPAD